MNNKIKKLFKMFNPWTININDAIKKIKKQGISNMKINIGDTWKDVVAVKQNIGDVWKDIF